MSTIFGIDFGMGTYAVIVVFEVVALAVPELPGI